MPTNTEAKRQKSGIPLFRIAGIQIVIDWSWFVIFLLIFWSLSAGYFPREFPGQSTKAYWLAGLVATLLFFASVLFHELSHSLMAIRTGISIPEITLFIFGGVSRLSEEPKDPWTELKIALVGPLSSFLLAVGFAIVRLAILPGQSSLALAVCSYLVWINVALGIFNLIPGFPLDGGRALRALLWHKTGSLTRATKWASDIGKGFAVALMVLGGIQIFAGMLIGGFWLLFIGMFLRSVAEGGYQELVMRQSLQHVQVHEVMVQDVVTVAPDLFLSQLIHQYFLRYGYKGFPVVLGDKVSGIVSLTEMKTVPEAEHATTPVSAVMIPLSEAVVITAGMSLAEAMQKMNRQGAGRLLVMEGERLRGMVTKTGLLRFLEIKRILES